MEIVSLLVWGEEVSLSRGCGDNHGSGDDLGRFLHRLGGELASGDQDDLPVTFRGEHQLGSLCSGGLA